MISFRPTTSSIQSIFQQIQRSNRSANWDDEAKYNIQWMQDGHIILREDRELKTYTAHKETQTIDIFPELARVCNGKQIGFFRVEIRLLKGGSNISVLGAVWWPSEEPGQTDAQFVDAWMLQAAKVSINDVEPNGELRKVLFFELPKCDVPKRSQRSSTHVTTAYKAERPFIFTKKQALGKLNMEIVYSRSADSQVLKTISAVLKDPEPSSNQHIIMTLTKQQYITAFNSKTTPSHTGELTISMCNSRKGMLYESHDLLSLVLTAIVNDMGYPRKKSDRNRF
uniref:Uncharacterized protein n=1 Tax=Psilocybe cubensis TaxID=181762 RepID=A0A8H7Y970_PSICU